MGHFGDIVYFNNCPNEELTINDAPRKLGRKWIPLMLLLCMVFSAFALSHVNLVVANFPKVGQKVFSGSVRRGILSMSGGHKFVMDPFGLRQFNNPEYTGTQVHYDPTEFEEKVNEAFESGAVKLVDGYAPFCKHLFVPNFAGVKCGYAKITADTKPMIESGYEARKDGELAVLVEYIDSSKMSAPDSTFLDIILYSREQIIKENEAMGETPPATDAPWGIISVKGQLCDYELPMQPITMMRNALGKEEGGSGVPLDKSKYAESVAFWREHVAIK